MDNNNKFQPPKTDDLEVQKLLNQYSDAYNNYYYGDCDLISDESFDDLEEKLFNLGFKNQIESEKKRLFQLNKSNDISNHISISLDKIKENPKQNVFLDLIKWFNKHRIDWRNIQFYVAPKFDGASVKIELNGKGEIVRIISRGGIDYTEILKDNPTIKDFINQNKQIKSYSKQLLLVTGEICIDKSSFEQKYSDKLKNPRNAVNSLVSKKETAMDLTFIPLTDGINGITNDYSEFVAGPFQPVDLNFLHNQIKNYYRNQKQNGDFLIDGVVIMYKTKQRIVKDNYPLNMVALKFKSESKQTTVVDIEWSQKKTGKLNPVLVLKPIELDGATVERVTIYNYDQLVNVYKCGIGSVVAVRKGDEITPKITETIKPSLDFNIPLNTNIVGKNLYYNDESEDDNTLKQKFILGTRCLNIEGIGPKMLGQLYKQMTILPHTSFDVFDLFNKDYRVDFSMIFGATSANFKKLCKIQEIKNIPLNTVIQMLQINGCGEVLSLKFAQMLTGQIPYSSDGIDEKVFKYIVNGDGRKRITDTIEKLNKFGVRVIKPVENNSDVITYEMSGNPVGLESKGIRTKAQFVNAMKTKFPNSLHTTLTKNTTLLIVDNLSSNTSKANKARRYNIKILTYEQALNQ